MTQAKKVLQKFRINGTSILPYRTQEGAVVDHIPPAYYKIEYDLFVGFYLAQVANTVKVPEKIYGSTNERCERIYRAFDQTKSPMAVGLFGLKGAGKTLLSNVIAKRAIEEMGLPVIDVSSSFTTDTEYLDFINSLGEVVIIFDEFLKRLSKSNKEDAESSMDAYQKARLARSRQDSMLPFFSGTNNSKRLVIMIDNEQTALSDFILHRPGRMRYVYNYNGVEEAVVRALSKDAGLPENKIDELVTYSARYFPSFDIISEIIKEMVQYPEESLAAITQVLNVPSMRVDTTNQIILTNYKLTNDFEKLGLNVTNELIKCNLRDSIPLFVTFNNPFKDEPLKDEDDYDDTNLSNYISYSIYKTHFNKPTLATVISIHKDSLVSIRGNLRQYSSAYGTFQFEVQDESDIEESNFNFQDWF